MASEELEQRYPDGSGFIAGQYEVFETQLVTLNQFAEHGIIKKINYGKNASQKCDALVIQRVPELRVVAIGEAKQPGALTPGNWKKIAEYLLARKLKPTGALIGYVTDGASTYWINGASDEVLEVVREDGQPMPSRVRYDDASFISELNYIIDNLDSSSGVVNIPEKSDPAKLAREVWQTVWRLKADKPEDCLATFVEIFIYKFLSDLGLMQTNEDGLPVSFDHLIDNVPIETSFTYYSKHVRSYIKVLFPAGPDGYSLINGIVLRGDNKDHNTIFHEILKKFKRFGSLRNTDPQFKTRLYESFLQESRTTTDYGQHFTPRKVVSAIHDMAGINNLSDGQEIADPASGVGGFVLEQMARDLESQWTVQGNDLTPVQNWHAFEIVPKTAILAKANALVHCGDLLANQPSRIPAFANWLNRVFVCKEKTALGSLEDRPAAAFNMILTNPPFVVSGSADISKLIKNNNARPKYFARKSSGVEGLFVQYIVQALKGGGDAWVLLPESFFLRTTDKVLRDWVLQNCKLDLLAVLPERTFFNTPKRVVIVHLKKRKTPLAAASAKSMLSKERTLLFAVSEIGETRDAKRFPERSDLPDLVRSYNLHRADGDLSGLDRAVVVQTEALYGAKSINIRHHWDHAVARELSLLGQDDDPAERRATIDRKVDAMAKVVEDWSKRRAELSPPPTPNRWRRLRLGDATVFGLRIGKRVLKKEVFKSKADVPLFSANVRKPFGYVKVANAGGLEFGGGGFGVSTATSIAGLSL